MRLRGISIGILLFPVLVNAESFHSDLRLIQENQKRIDQKMAHLGFGVSSVPSQSLVAEKKEEVRLFQLHDTLTRISIPIGKILFGKTLTRLVVGSESSPVLIELEGEQGVLSGLRLMGKARQASTEGRVSLDLERLLLSSGRAVALQAVGLDDSGAFGIPAQVFSGKAWALAGSVATGFTSGLAASQQTLNANAFGFAQSQTTGRNAILQGVAQAAADQSKRLIEEATREKPVLVIEANTPVTVLVNEEVRL